MIGVLAKAQEEEIVAEFFELFKTPWEFFDKTHDYDVLIVTVNDFSATNARLVIYYSSEQNTFDIQEMIKIKPLDKNNFLVVENDYLPIYGQMSVIRGHGQPLYRIKDSDASAGLETKRPDQCIIRIGYDLFQEVAHLLSTGQPPENALIPALDLHISILRKLILHAGIILVEIPPVPAGYNFIVCLTHDIDFIRIRDHKFDHTILGFLYRAAIGTLIDVLQRKRSIKELYQNWKAVLKLPFVYLGLASDYWFKFDRYMELEKNVNAKSTFFVIPFKNRAGHKVAGKYAYRRAARYDVMDIQEMVKKLINNRFEVGVHGIDAWHDTTAAREEKNRIAAISEKNRVGIRMHWLCFDKNTFGKLDEAGFAYDSTFGFNDAVGYRAGTSQAFKPIGTKNIFELPLLIQDTALFNPKHMSLTKNEAWDLSKDLIEKAAVYGGMLTILWHDRSLSPERLYEDFYIKLLAELKNRKTWFATATDICDWFNSRRAVKFEDVKVSNRNISIKSRTENNDEKPNLRVRIYDPSPIKDYTSIAFKNNFSYTDVPWQKEIHFSVS